MKIAALTLTAILASTGIAHAQHLPSYGLPVGDQIRQGMTNPPPSLAYQPNFDDLAICRNVLLQGVVQYLGRNVVTLTWLQTNGLRRTRLATHWAVR